MTKRVGIPPICYVVMPYGRKTDQNGLLIDSDAVYDKLIRPACQLADLDVARGDEAKIRRVQLAVALR